MWMRRIVLKWYLSDIHGKSSWFCSTLILEQSHTRHSFVTHSQSIHFSKRLIYDYGMTLYINLFLKNFLLLIILSLICLFVFRILFVLNFNFFLLYLNVLLNLLITRNLMKWSVWLFSIWFVSDNNLQSDHSCQCNFVFGF